MSSLLTQVERLLKKAGASGTNIKVQYNGKSYEIFKDNHTSHSYFLARFPGSRIEFVYDDDQFKHGDREAFKQSALKALKEALG